MHKLNTTDFVGLASVRRWRRSSLAGESAGLHRLRPIPGLPGAVRQVNDGDFSETETFSAEGLTSGSGIHDV